MESRVNAMKNPSSVLLSLLISLAISGCGRKESPVPASNKMDPPVRSSAVRPMPEPAGPSDLPPGPGFAGLTEAKGDSQAGSAILLSSQAADSLLDAYAADLLWLAAGSWNLPSSKGPTIISSSVKGAHL
jgi:hypothetical protein